MATAAIVAMQPLQSSVQQQIQQPHPTAQVAHLGNDPLDPHRLSLNNGILQAEFFIGPPLAPINATPVKNIQEYLAKRDNSDEFVTLKVLTVSREGADDTTEDRQGKVLLHNEYQVLSLLQDHPGVIHHHGLFKERNRFILVLDCLVSHEYDPAGQFKDFVNLQHYVIGERRLHEKEALELFCAVLTTVESLHKVLLVIVYIFHTYQKGHYFDSCNCFNSTLDQLHRN